MTPKDCLYEIIKAEGDCHDIATDDCYNSCPFFDLCVDHGDISGEGMLQAAEALLENDVTFTDEILVTLFL